MRRELVDDPLKAFWLKERDALLNMWRSFLCSGNHAGLECLFQLCLLVGHLGSILLLHPSCHHGSSHTSAQSTQVQAPAETGNGGSGAEGAGGGGEGIPGAFESGGTERADQHFLRGAAELDHSTVHLQADPARASVRPTLCGPGTDRAAGSRYPGIDA